MGTPTPVTMQVRTADESVGVTFTNVASASSRGPVQASGLVGRACGDAVARVGGGARAAVPVGSHNRTRSEDVAWPRDARSEDVAWPREERGRAPARGTRWPAWRGCGSDCGCACGELET